MQTVGGEKISCLKVILYLLLLHLLQQASTNLMCYRAEELEIALMEMVKEDNRLELSARVNLLKTSSSCCYQEVI